MPIDKSAYWDEEDGPMPEGLKALLDSLETRSEFYREYVVSDWNHAILCEIPMEAALSLVELSRFYPLLSSFYVGGNPTKGESPRYLMNKGAVRVDVPSDIYEHRKAVWVYNHDGTYFLTVAPD